METHARFHDQYHGRHGLYHDQVHGSRGLLVHGNHEQYHDRVRGSHGLPVHGNREQSHDQTLVHSSHHDQFHGSHITPNHALRVQNHGDLDHDRGEYCAVHDPLNDQHVAAQSHDCSQSHGNHQNHDDHRIRNHNPYVPCIHNQENGLNRNSRYGDPLDIRSDHTSFLRNNLGANTAVAMVHSSHRSLNRPELRLRTSRGPQLSTLSFL